MGFKFYGQGDRQKYLMAWDSFNNFIGDGATLQMVFHFSYYDYAYVGAKQRTETEIRGGMPGRGFKIELAAGVARSRGDGIVREPENSHASK